MEVPVATFCAPKLLLDMISAFGEWFPLLGGSVVPSFLLPVLTSPALCLCPRGNRKAVFLAAGLISFTLMVGVILYALRVMCRKV